MDYMSAESLVQNLSPCENSEMERMRMAHPVQFMSVSACPTTQIHSGGFSARLLLSALKKGLSLIVTR
jgi:hypothetical protein